MYSPSFTFYILGPGHYGAHRRPETLCFYRERHQCSLSYRGEAITCREIDCQYDVVRVVALWLKPNLAKLQPHNISWPTHDYSFIIILSINIWEFTQNKPIVEDHICSKQNPSPRCKWSCRFQPEPECGNGGEQPERITWGLQKRSWDFVNKPEASSSQAEIILPQTRVSSVLWLWRCFFVTSQSIAWNKRNIWVKRKHEESNRKKCLCHHPTSNSRSSRRDCDAYDLKVGDWKGSTDLGMTPLIPEQVFRRWSVSILKQKKRCAEYWSTLTYLHAAMQRYLWHSDDVKTRLNPGFQLSNAVKPSLCLHCWHRRSA